ncbi:hypothetical protein MASR1M60_24220 [Rhodocyclaceae bacterium]
MNHRRLTLIDVLQPQAFGITPERARVTRTILQPEVDAFEQMEAQASAQEKSALAGRQSTASRQPQVAL